MSQEDFEREDVQGGRHGGWGECIYCGSDGGSEGLRDEHVIPLSLNGDLVLTNASCRTCERAINPADTHLAKIVYWHFRLHTGAATRNPKERPATINATFEIDGEQTVRELPAKDAPFSLAMPIWGDPGFFRGVPIDAPFPEPSFHIYHWMPADLSERLGLEQDAEFKVWSGGRINPELFARAIAKIAYCHMILKYGLRGFRRLALPDIILGKSTATAYFVGSPLRDPAPPSPKGEMHRVQISEGRALDGQLRVYLVHVRLFANSAYLDHGMPWYTVLAGGPA